MDRLDIMAAKGSRRAESALCTISGKTFGKESVLAPLVPTKLVALSVNLINVDQRVVESDLVKGKNKINILTCKMHNTNENVSFREKVEGNTLSPTIDVTDSKRSKKL